jgi:hypothetical protein
MEINTGFYPFAVLYALALVILAIGYYDTEIRYNNYFLNLGYYIDILGNALLAGNPKLTVSARTGLNALNAKKLGIRSFKWRYWILCEKIINWAFKPIDGFNHCHDAYIWTKRKFPEENIHQGPTIVFGIGLPVITLVCLVLRPLIWALAKYGK